MKKHIVELTKKEQAYLKEIISKGKTLARKIQHAQILLKADESEGGPAWSDQQISESYGVSTRTVERIRQRCVDYGLEDALVRRQNPSGPHRRILDGKGEAHLVKLACSKPPKGRERWSIRLLRDRFVELNIVEGISRETMRATLKKTNLSLG